MRRVGLVFLAIGLCGFLICSTQRDGSPGDAWESARWMFVGVAVIGTVFTILPGKAEPS